jgi:oxalate decarboxylase/phosphoglucose isomerase-like protein (cupin superfamily)
MFSSRGRHRTEVFEAGDTGYIPMGYGHSIEIASDKEPAEVLIGFNSGQLPEDQSLDLARREPVLPARG